MPNDSDLNFYHMMLGTPKTLRRPNHYQLLDVDPYAADTQTIRNASADQNGKLMGWQNSKHYKQAGQLMLELAKARGVLLDPDQKQAYDQKLGLVSVDEELVILLEAEPEEEPIVLRSVEEEPAATSRGTRKPRVANRREHDSQTTRVKTGLGRRVVAACLFGVLIVGGISWAAWSRRQEETQPDQVAVNIKDEAESSLSTPAELDKSDTVANVSPTPNPIVKTPEILPVTSETKPPALAVAPFDAETALEHQTAWSKHLNLPVEVTNKAGLKLRLIPPGEFTMGSPENEEHRNLLEVQHRVRITKPFYMETHEMTAGEFDAVMDYQAWETLNIDPQLPVMLVSWFECVLFCNKLSEKEGLPPYYSLTDIIYLGEPVWRLKVTINGGNGYRLPTEAEWEYACRAGTTTAFHVGDSLTATQANVSEPDKPRPTLVAGGMFAPNAFGLFDMHGNLAEWCFDTMGPYASRSDLVADPVREIVPRLSQYLRIRRGGRYAHPSFDSRSARRSWAGPDSKGAGFRVIRNVGGKEELTQTTKAVPSQLTAETHSSPETETPENFAVAPFSAVQAKQHQADWSKHLNLPAEATNPIGMKLRLIPPGEFQMGSPTTEPNRRPGEQLHSVKLTSAFYIGVYEVTTKEFRALLTRTSPASLQAKIDQFGDLPISRVTWFDAVRFCNRLSEKESLPPYYELKKLVQSGEQIRGAEVTVLGGEGYRLPSEAEWEYACRAGTTTMSNLGNVMNSNHRGKGKGINPLVPVGKYPVNPFGLYNMHGNAAEWCFDRFDQNYYQSAPPEDPICTQAGPRVTRQQRVYRGGSHTHYAENCRSAARMAAAPDERSSRRSIGFRVARTVNTPPSG